MTRLTVLKIAGNRLEALPVDFGKLNALVFLDAGLNHLTTLPDSFARLGKLVHLELNDNTFATFPEVLLELTALETLDFGNYTEVEPVNKIAEVPESIVRLTRLVELNVTGNPIETPPPEVALNGIDAIKSYFQQLQSEGEDHLFEAKVLIVGEGGAGKTTLAKKLQDSQYALRDEETTRGIEVHPWQFCMPGGPPFRVNVWDFGGQEIYHATHQLFLTKRSLYLLVADARKEDTDFYYWLNVVNLLSDGSPMLIVKNERHDRHREINERALRAQFDNLKETLATNLATGRGLEYLVDEIQHHILNLPHVGAPVPRTWVRVRDMLEQDLRNYIGIDEYAEVCRRNGIRDRARMMVLSGYLHDLGVILHFQEDPLLSRMLVLKPNWGTRALYKVLDDLTVIANRGEFGPGDLELIWQEPEYSDMRNELLQLMMKFRLAYRIPNTDKYIAPQLLRENQPPYPWDDVDNLILRYTFDFMPKGILTQFIVAMHGLVTDQHFVWKSGIVLAKNEATAEVIEDYPRREIQIRVSGKGRKELLTIVSYELDKIHDTFRTLRVSKWIPCNCDVCKVSTEPNSYRYETLRRFTNEHHELIQCQKSFQMVNVWWLIDDVIGRESFVSQEEKRKERQNVFVGAHIGTLVMTRNGEVTVQHTNRGNVMVNNKRVVARSAWANGSFYLFVFVVVVAGMGYLAQNVPFVALPVIVVAGVIFVPLIGALQLRQDDRLSEKSFLELMGIVIGQLPLIGRLLRRQG